MTLTHLQRVQLARRELKTLKSMPKEQFLDWLEDNEQIYLAFRRFALEALRKGRTRFSVYMIRERVRWYTTIEWGGQFKISNNVTPYIARVLVLELPILDKIFRRQAVDQEELDRFVQRNLFDQVFEVHP